MLLILLALFFALGGRLAFLQVVRHSHYDQLAQSQRMRPTTIDPKRGTIFDRNGTILALSVGADGYLLKHTEPEALVQQLLTCSKQRLLLDPKMQLLDSGRASLSHLTGKCVDEVELTERECQTLRLIAEGMSNKLIARALGISDGTVKIHVKHLLSKLNLHSRLELAAWAHRCGFLERGVSSERPAG